MICKFSFFYTICQYLISRSNIKEIPSLSYAMVQYIKYQTLAIKGHFNSLVLVETSYWQFVCSTTATWLHTFNYKLNVTVYYPYGLSLCFPRRYSSADFDYSSFCLTLVSLVWLLYLSLKSSLNINQEQHFHSSYQ